MAGESRIRTTTDGRNQDPTAQGQTPPVHLRPTLTSFLLAPVPTQAVRVDTRNKDWTHPILILRSHLIDKLLPESRTGDIPPPARQDMMGLMEKRNLLTPGADEAGGGERLTERGLRLHLLHTRFPFYCTECLYMCTVLLNPESRITAVSVFVTHSFLLANPKRMRYQTVITNLASPPGLPSGTQAMTPIKQSGPENTHASARLVC